MDTQPKRSRRLRKKLYLDEFKQTGFQIQGNIIADDYCNDLVFDLIDTICEFCISINLNVVFLYENGSGHVSALIGAKARYGQVTNADRTNAYNWFSTKLEDIVISEVIDLHYSEVN